MNVIGEQIKKYRIEKGITQEQLGQLIGVTTQAVSRWERGGTPDADILPHLSDVLGVSIDSLFGREEQSYALSLAKQLCQMSHEDAYKYAFSLCWAIEFGLMSDISLLDDFMNKFIRDSAIAHDKTIDYYAKIISDSGIADVRMTNDFHHFFFMVEPENGRIINQLEDFESIRKVFELFSDKKLLKIIFYIYSLQNMPVATSLISKNTGIDQNEVDRCMDTLCSFNLTTRTVVATANGDLNSYTFRKESFFIPLLCFADEIAKKNIHLFFGRFDRTKPFL